MVCGDTDHGEIGHGEGVRLVHPLVFFFGVKLWAGFGHVGEVPMALDDWGVWLGVGLCFSDGLLDGILLSRGAIIPPLSSDVADVDGSGIESLYPVGREIKGLQAVDGPGCIDEQVVSWTIPFEDITPIVADGCHCCGLRCGCAVNDDKIDLTCHVVLITYLTNELLYP